MMMMSRYKTLTGPVYRTLSKIRRRRCSSSSTGSSNVLNTGLNRSFGPVLTIHPLVLKLSLFKITPT